VIVNWNGWRDTIECLESLLYLENNDFRLIVCDNGSSDGSLEKIIKWAEGNLEVKLPAFLRPTHKPIKKPLSFEQFSPDDSFQKSVSPDKKLILIDCRDNLGFAGGNNVGLRFAMEQADFGEAWLLNNDTVVDQWSLDRQLEKLNSDKRIGISGSTILYYDNPEKVQAFGGARYFSCIGLAMHVGRFFGSYRKVNESYIESMMSYISGASMMVSSEFLETVGLMSEEYFLYYEELDWALRADGKFKLGYAQDSIVYHKAGSSIGSSKNAVKRSLLSDYYLMSNRLKITKKFFPRYQLFVRLFLLFEAFLRLLSGKFKFAGMIFRIASGVKNDVPVSEKTNSGSAKG